MTPVAMMESFQGILLTDEDMPLFLLALQAVEKIEVTNNEIHGGVSFDTESSGLNVRNKVDYCMGWCFDIEGYGAAYMPMRHLEGNVDKHWWYAVWDILKTKDMIWHNRKFDFHSVQTLGFDPLELQGKHYDTLMVATLVNREFVSKEMDWLAKILLKVSKMDGDTFHKMGEIYGYANLSATLYRQYGSWDARLTRLLLQYLWPRLCQQGLERPYWDTEAPFTTLLYKIEQRGVGTNPDLCEGKSRRGRSRLGTIQRELGFNPASPVDLKRILLTELGLPVFKHTKSCEKCMKDKLPVHTHEGPPSFDKQAMEDYDDILQASNNPTAKLISEFRGWQKAVSSLWEPTMEKVGPDGFLRTEFKQHGTVTGRLSSANPNLQQVPRGGKYVWNFDAKAAFTSGRTGLILFGWDYSQIELRLGAAYGNEGVLLTEFSKEGADPFSVLAPLIFGHLDEGTRHDTKTFVYSNLFGAGLRKVALQLGRTVEETEPLYRRYHNSIPGIISISKRVGELAQQRGYITYWDGSRRQFRNRSDSYKAWNSLLQGGAAQLVKKAMLRCEEFEADDCFMVLTVHDEITFCIDPERIKYYEPLITEAMTDWPDFGVKLAIAGKEWK